MKKLFTLALAAILLLSTFTGCDAAIESLQNALSSSATGNFLSTNCEVTFVPNNGQSSVSVVIGKGKTVATPADPVKANYLFGGWYTDSALTNRYDFAQPVKQDLRLYAKYELDATTLTNKISTDTIKGVVKIYNKSYDTFLGFETASTTSQGSGFCFHIQDGCYYILTNCHVAQKDASYANQKFTIEDYQGNTYEGHLYKNPNKTVSALAASYDLACLYFEASSTNVQALSIVSKNPEANADVISIGSPKGQSNAITFGQIAGYGKVTLTDSLPSTSNVTFDVILHTAYINNGSSGGPLLDADLNVIGVNYAGSTSNDYGCAIPVEKVIEFLKTYIYN